jgi:transposase
VPVCPSDLTDAQLRLRWADSYYDGRPLADWVRAVPGMSLVVIKRTETRTFKVVPRRWVVEQTFGWLLHYRRLVRGHEPRPEHHEATVYWASVLIMTKRLTRRRGIAPAVNQRWGQPRSVPEAA